MSTRVYKRGTDDTRSADVDLWSVSFADKIFSSFVMLYFSNLFYSIWFSIIKLYLLSTKLEKINKDSFVTWKERFKPQRSKHKLVLWEFDIPSSCYQKLFEQRLRKWLQNLEFYFIVYSAVFSLLIRNSLISSDYSSFHPSNWQCCYSVLVCWLSSWCRAQNSLRRCAVLSSN